MAYMVFFLSFQAGAVINNTYNNRADTFKRTVRRGTIYDAYGNVLARTDVYDDGTEERIYPYGSTFAQVIGFEANGGLGLESSYNYYLLASHVNMFEKISNEFNGVKNPGDSMYTTLRADLQGYISDLMGNVPGGCIALNPETGEIYADVSKPDFDPNRIEENWEAIIADVEGSPLLNRVTQGQYTPGSTFKLFTILEYIRENPNFRDYTYQCEGTIYGENYKINCFDGEVHGHEDLRTAFAVSCNCAFAHMGLLLDRDLFMENNQKLLFNSKIDIEQVIGQLQRDIEEQKNGIKRFEDEQEEKSIISYQELFEQTQKEISNQEVNAEPINKKIENIENEQPIKKFRNSEFISPIFGRVDNDIKYPTIPSFREKEEEEKPQPIETIEIEKTIDLKPLQEEIKKNEEFLNMLKEFRKNLE